MIHPIPEDVPAIFQSVLEEDSSNEAIEKHLSVVLENYVKHVDEPSKNMILLFLSTYSNHIFKNILSFDRVYDVLFGQLKKCSNLFRGQVFTNLTSIIVQLDVMNKNSVRFEKFVNSLLEIISKVNSSVDRVLRQMCCECLIELEMRYPTLLMNYGDYLLTLCQKENTHALSSYCSLLLVILTHQMKTMRFSFLERSVDGMSSIVSTLSSGNSSSSGGPKVHPSKAKLIEFSVPSHFYQFEPKDMELERKKLMVSKRAKRYLNQLRKTLSFLIYCSHFFTVYGKARIALSIYELGKFCEFPSKVIKGEFHQKLLYHTSPYMVHTFVRLNQLHNFKGSAAIDAEVEERLLSVSRDYSSQPYFRQIGVCLLEKTKRVNEVAPFFQDELRIIHSKLIFLARCSKILFPSASGPLPNQNKESMQILFIRNCVNLIMDFEQFPQENNDRLFIIIDFVYEFLKVHPDKKGVVLEFFLSLITEENTQLLLKYFLHFVEKIDPRDFESFKSEKRGGGGGGDLGDYASFPIFFLNSMEKNIEFTENSFVGYVPLVKRIFSEQKMDPFGLLSQIEQFVKGQIHKKGVWIIGFNVLECLKVVLLHHYSKCFNQVNSLLFYLLNHYRNIDIKDRSLFFFQLVNHVTFEKMKYFLTVQDFNLVDFDELDYGNDRSALDSEVKVYKPFLKLERVFPEEIKIEAVTSSDTVTEEVLKDESPRNSNTDTNFDFFSYEQDLRALSEEECPSLNIVLHFRIQFDRSIIEDEDVEKLYGIKLQFPSLEQFEDVLDVTLPVLKKDSDLFYRFDLRIQPIFPIPGEFKDLCVTFSTEKNVKCQSTINNLKVSLEDLFSNMPIPTVSKTDVFDYLWEKGEKSIKILRLSNSDVESYCKEKFSQFVISESFEDEVLIRKKVLIFLPPKHHLALEFVIKEKKTVVNIRTDFYQILVYLDDFLSIK